MLIWTFMIDRKMTDWDVISLNEFTVDPSVLSRYLDSKGRHVIHVALRNRIPVHDVIADALPHSLEARDLSRDGFYPFQIAAITFVAEVENRAGRVEYEDNENEHEKEALETSILFEIIRRDPLCITWSCNSTSELASRPVQKRNLDDGCLSVFRDKRRYETAATVSSCEQRRWPYVSGTGFRMPTK